MLKVGYFTDWSIYDETFSSIKDLVLLGGYTHIIYAFAVPDNNCGLVFADPNAALDRRCVNELIRLKDEVPELQVGVSIGGWNHRKAFEGTDRSFPGKIAEFLSGHGFDFVDIDWEFDSPEDAQRCKPVLHKLIKSLEGLGVRTSVALQCNWAILKELDLGPITYAVDFFILMGYMLTGSWSKLACHHSALYNAPHCISDVVDLLQQVVESRKICVGVSGIVVEFSSCTEIGEPFKACSLAKSSHTNLLEYEEMWDEQAGCSFFKARDSVLSVETLRSLEAKEDFVRRNGLEGLAVWDIHDYSFIHSSNQS